MSSQVNHLGVSKRKPIRPSNLVEFNYSEDIDGQIYAFEEEHSDSSKSANTSNELSSKLVYDPESSKDIKEYDYVDKTSNTCLWITLLFVVILLLAAALITVSNSSEKRCSFEMLRQKYKDQHSKMWHTLSSGVENILRDRTKNPVVNLFVHNDSKKLKTMVGEIAKETSRCFGGQLIEMSEFDFTSPRAMEDYGYAILKFKEKIQNGRVALIVNLNAIPAESACALHTICDTHSPVAEDIVIYLTLVIPSTIGNEVNIARDTLTNLWGSKLKNNVLEPLITRVTDQILTLI
uniref:Torsin-1A-interacting protein 2 n=1 Tax=Bactrocera dorsalis TaxID=27457 RepID=A0A034WK89_BACDO